MYALYAYLGDFVESLCEEVREYLASIADVLSEDDFAAEVMAAFGD